MLSLSLVYAEADGQVAHDVRAYLAANCDVGLQGFLTGDHFLEVVDRALSADATIILLSPHAIPGPLLREDWEPVFTQSPEAPATPIAFVQVELCAFPKVLLRSNLFHLRPDPLSCFRSLKRWVFDLCPPAHRASMPAVKAPPAPTELWRRLADQPATLEHPSLQEARAFAFQAQYEFESVFWIDCRESTLAEVAGEMGVRMGLRLRGDAPANVQSIRDFCSRYRCLIVLESPQPELSRKFQALGRSSVLIASASLPLPPASLDGALSQIKSLTGWIRNPSAAIPLSRDIRRTLEWLRSVDWNCAQRLAAAALAYYKHHDRLAEAFELIDIMVRAALRRGDRQGAHDLARESHWIRDEWGQSPGASVSVIDIPPSPRQLPLFP